MMPLHEYQQRGVDMLTSDLGGAGLGLDPGMGKTRIVEEAIVRLKAQYSGLQVLLIAPIQPMYGTWRQEAEKWGLDLTFSIVHGTPKQRTVALLKRADVYLINPEGVKWLFTNKELDLPDWKVLVVDESTKFKKSDTARFKAIKKHLKNFYWRWIATGTIAPNGLEDLFGQVYLTDEGAALGKYITHFRKKYFVDVGPPTFPKWVPLPGAADEVTDLISRRILLLKAEDYLEMPEMITVEREVTLPDNAREHYDKLEKDFYVELDGADIMAPNAAALGNKLRQVSNGFSYDVDSVGIHIHDEKLVALQDLLEELNGHPVLIMYEFRHDLHKIQKALGKDAVCITGMNPYDLTETLNKFNNGEIKYLLVHPQSVHGMNIQKSCHHIIWFSIIWNLEHYIQANTRIYRQGQSSQTVMVYHIVGKDTKDQHVGRALAQKGSVQASIENAIRSKSDVEFFAAEAERERKDRAHSLSQDYCQQG